MPEPNDNLENAAKIVEYYVNAQLDGAFMGNAQWEIGYGPRWDPQQYVVRGHDPSARRPSSRSRYLAGAAANHRRYFLCSPMDHAGKSGLCLAPPS